MRRLNIRDSLFPAVFLLCVTALLPQAQAAAPQEYVLMLSAQASESPPKIHLTWPAKPTPVGSYSVFRKSKDATSWGTAVATLDGSATAYEDTNVAVGQAYEYKVSNGSYAGYVFAGIKVPAVESRGKLVLLVEAEQATALKAELETLKKSLLGDGWTVVRHDVSRQATPQSVRALVQADYNADPTHVKAVFLLGHVPVFRSGNIAPDGHDDHRGPWPADAYYGSMSASWENSPSTIPGEVQLQVGRVDFDKMPAFKKNATELLRQYLNKSSQYRLGKMVTTKDAFVSDGFGRGNLDNAAVYNGYKLFPTLWGPGARVDEGAWAQYLSADTYTWGHINGYGNYTSTAAVGGSLTTGGIAAAQKFGIVFAQTFGSYFGDWDREDTPTAVYQNNLLRAFLATEEHGLANVWAGRPHWFFHHMALGETIGHSARLTQNNRSGGLYTPTGSGLGQVHIALMGDPTLRMFPVLPVTNLRATRMPGENRLQWSASGDNTVSDCYVYGASHPDGPYVRLGTTKSTQWTHTNPGSTRHYMVRALKLTSTASGSFYNLSQGALAEAEEAAVPPEAEVDAIAVLTQPRKLSYTEGSALALSGLRIRLGFDDGSAEEVPFEAFAAYNLTADPKDGTVLYRDSHHGIGITITYGNSLTLQVTTAPLEVTEPLIEEPLVPVEPPQLPPEETPPPLPVDTEEASLGKLKGVAGCNSTSSPFEVGGLVLFVLLGGFCLRRGRQHHGAPAA